MFSWLSKKPEYLDIQFQDLSLMLTQDTENPTYRLNNLEPEKLDFSLESLKHIDDYLESISDKPPEENDYLRVVLRVGAYVGEVMRKQKANYHWVSHEEASKLSDLVAEWEPSIATAGILWAGKDSFSFPLGKVCKYLENGREDSLYFFAKVLLEK